MNFNQFKKLYGSDKKCLNYILNIKYKSCPKCRGQLYPVRGRKSFACSKGHQVYPLKGTIFEKSTTKLSSWFLAIYLMSETRNGVSAKFLQRMLGVKYDTAWRMNHKIRELMEEDFRLEGEVEMDETYFGRKDWFRGKKWWSTYQIMAKTPLFGMIERGGRVKVIRIKEASTQILVKGTLDYVSKSSRVITDGHFGYRPLPNYGYFHQSVNHTLHYVDKEDVSIHTQNIEGFWGRMKSGMTGTYRHISLKYLMKYVDEFSFRHNHRKNIFGALLERIAYEVLPF